MSYIREFRIVFEVCLYYVKIALKLYFPMLRDRVPLSDKDTFVLSFPIVFPISLFYFICSYDIV
jgi:hypothetical protein